MRVYVVLAFTFLFLIQSAVTKKLSTRDNEVIGSEKNELDLIAEDEDENLNEIESDVGGYTKDPCLKVRCKTGKVCEVNDKGKGVCVCIPECPQESDERRKVCSNYNETWNSDCDLYQMRCYCDEAHENCKNRKYKHVHIDYYGSCREIPECTDEQMADFPRRMREWLFNVMQDLAQRKELQDDYLQLEREAEQNLAKKWSNAVIWKFCDLDSPPFDRSVSRHELFPLRAPLLAMEHCIAPFLNDCDKDDDHKISLKEWGLCLGLKESEIEDRCSQVRDEN